MSQQTTGLEKIFTELFFGGDSGTPNPVAHSTYGLVRTMLLFVIAFVIQFAIDAVVNQKDLLSVSTWQSLLIPVVVIVLEFGWRLARAFNSPLAYLFKAEETKISKQTGTKIPDIPTEIDLPEPPKS